MTRAKQFAITFIFVFLAVLVAILAPIIRVLYFSDGSGGLAAVSVGVSAASCAGVCAAGRRIPLLAGLARHAAARRSALQAPLTGRAVPS